MRALFIAACLVVCIVFYRADLQLLGWLPPAFNALIVLGGLFFLGVVLVLLRLRRQSIEKGAQLMGWLLIIAAVLALLERPFEPRYTDVLAANQSRTLASPDHVLVSAHIVSAKAGLFEVEVQSGTASFDAMLDTGASQVLLTYETAQKLGLTPANLSFETQVDTVAGSVKVAEIVLPSLKVGTIEITHIPAAISPQGVTHKNLLGASFLAKLSSVEFQSNRAILTLRSR